MVISHKEGGVYLFCGEEGFLKEEASRTLISTLLSPKSKRLDCDIYNARDDYAKICDAINTVPFLSEKRVVVIKEVEELPEEKRDGFLSYLKNLPKYTYLILHSNKTPSSDRFIAAISHYAKTSLFKRPTVRELRDWIHKRLNSYKKTIARDALELFLELKGNEDIATLSKELEKLAAYKGEDNIIAKEDVIKLIGKSLAKNIFDLTDAINSRDAGHALSLLHELLSEDKNRIPEILGLMGWQLRNRQKKGRFNARQFRESSRLLVETDRRVKRGSLHLDSILLEELIVKLCRG